MKTKQLSQSKYVAGNKISKRKVVQTNKGRSDEEKKKEEENMLM